MTRSIITGSTSQQESDTTPKTPPLEASVAGEQAAPPTKSKNALAEAFPAWDLVPSVQFVRRARS